MPAANAPALEMRSRIRFVADDSQDTVEASFDGVVLTSEADAAQWADVVSELMARYQKKLWLLIDLRGLIVRPAASATFGRLRAVVLERYTHASVRYGGDPWTLVAINTSAVLHQTHGNVFSTRAEALAYLLQLRAQLLPAIE